MIAIHKYFTLRINIYEYFIVVQFTTIWLELYIFNFNFLFVYDFIINTAFVWMCVVQSGTRIPTHALLIQIVCARKVETLYLNAL